MEQYTTKLEGVGKDQKKKILKWYQILAQSRNKEFKLSIQQASKPTHVVLNVIYSHSFLQQDTSA